eukprot:3615360-Pyramimonas_sp.AAC.2
MHRLSRGVRVLTSTRPSVAGGIQDHGIQTPPHIIVNRDDNYNVIGGDTFIEGEDYVQVRATSPHF